MKHSVRREWSPDNRLMWASRCPVYGVAVYTHGRDAALSDAQRCPCWTLVRH